MQHDLVDHVDFHLTAPANLNSRLTDLGSDPPELKRNRLGVYLHWTLPRCYRSGTASASDTPAGRSPTEVTDTSVPKFPVVPNRYLIVRRLTWQKSDDNTKLPAFQTWVVESNRVQKVQDIKADVDLEVDVAPFVKDDPGTDPNRILENQAEFFVGNRNKYTGWSNPTPTLWTEQQQANPTVQPDPSFIDLTVLGSSNPLFPGKSE